MTRNYYYWYYWQTVVLVLLLFCVVMKTEKPNVWRPMTNDIESYYYYYSMTKLIMTINDLINVCVCIIEIFSINDPMKTIIEIQYYYYSDIDPDNEDSNDYWRRDMSMIEMIESGNDIIIVRPSIISE